MLQSRFSHVAGSTRGTNELVRPSAPARTNPQLRPSNSAKPRMQRCPKQENQSACVVHHACSAKAPLAVVDCDRCLVGDPCASSTTGPEDPGRAKRSPHVGCSCNTPHLAKAEMKLRLPLAAKQQPSALQLAKPSKPKPALYRACPKQLRRRRAGRLRCRGTGRP